VETVIEAGLLLLLPCGNELLADWHASSVLKPVLEYDFLVFDRLDYRHSDRTGLVLGAIDPATLVISRFLSPAFPGFSTHRVVRLNDPSAEGSRGRDPSRAKELEVFETIADTSPSP
jgi:hypothetical protein